jgi:lysophospholipase L1-like esterase
MKKLIYRLVLVFKWLIITAILVEVFSFLIVITTNYWIYHQLRDGDRVHYDPYILFQTSGYPRPTRHNPGAPEKGKVKIIWMFGGSTLAGATAYDDRTIPSYLAASLNEEEPRIPAYLTNYGEPSFNSLMETKYLQKVLIENPSMPDLIIFYDGANDCTYFAQTRRPEGGHLGYSKVQGLIESYQRSFFGLLKPLNAAIYASFTRELYEKLQQGVLPIAADASELQRFVDMAEKRYDYVNQTAVCRGAGFLLFWQPDWWIETGQVAPEVRRREEDYCIVGRHFAFRHNFTVINNALVARLKNKPYFVDFQNILCARTEPIYQDDGIHLEDAGRKMVAGGMARVLKERFRHPAEIPDPLIGRQ